MRYKYLIGLFFLLVLSLVITSCKNPIGQATSTFATYTCSDSDAQNSLFIKGTAYVRNASSGVIVSSKSDTCSGESIIEYYCNGSNIEYKSLSCPSGYSCSSGVCKTIVTQPNTTTTLPPTTNVTQPNTTTTLPPTTTNASGPIVYLGKNGVGSSATSCTFNRINGYYNFDKNASSYISCPSFTRNNLKTACAYVTSGAIDFYAGPVDNSGYQRIDYYATRTSFTVSVRNPTSANYRYWSAQLNSTPSYPFHVCFTQNDMETPKVYINNIEYPMKVSAQSGTPSRPTGTNLWINRYSNTGTYYLSGSATELKVWNRVLSRSEITAEYNSARTP